MIWLVLAYLFHTLGLCLSPVGLSYVSKLVPPRMIAFGMWYFIAIGNKLAALGGQIENITHEYSLSTFFFNFVSQIQSLIIVLNPLLKN